MRLATIGLLAALLLAASGMAASVALAQTDEAAKTPKPVGSFKAWQAMTYEEKGLLMCYTISRPGTKLGDLAGRGDAGALVTRVANSEGGDEVSIVLGYEPKKNSPVLVKIGRKTFRLTKLAEGRAWAKDDAQDRQMVEAMKHADWLVVNATSAAKGNVKTQDTYALAGFAKAYQAMTNACR